MSRGSKEPEMKLNNRFSSKNQSLFTNATDINLHIFIHLLTGLINMLIELIKVKTGPTEDLLYTLDHILGHATAT